MPMLEIVNKTIDLLRSQLKNQPIACTLIAMKLLKNILKALWAIPCFIVNMFTKPKNGMTRRQGWFLWWQHHLPQHDLSRLAGLLANLESPVWFKNWAIAYFSKRYKITLDEAIETNPELYPSFNAFFTRHLKAELRPIASAGIVSPVDGTISQMGDITRGKIFQAKGMDYDLFSLLGGREQWAEQFSEGRFVTIYLAPSDYHRVHMPLEGTLKEMIHVPGNLFSVNPTTVDYEPHVFARNERVISIFETPIGPMAVILVGAMIVGSIQTVWCGEVSPPRAYEVYSWPYDNDAPRLAKGDEMGHFQLGSTVILLLPNKQLQWDNGLKAGSKLQYGQKIGQ